jgi:hypothetical protein
MAVLHLETQAAVVQLQLGVATTLVLVLIIRRAGISPVQIACCVAVATAGELVLSGASRLYRYHHAVLPLYVPPGHGVFYALAVWTSRQPLLLRCEKGIRLTVLVLGTVLAAISLVWNHDSWGFLWWVGVAAFLAMSRQRVLLSACVILTMFLELAGTYNGNWQWAPTVPLLGWSSANPPAGVGILYVLLDLIVVAVTSFVIGTRDATFSSPDRPERNELRASG